MYLALERRNNSLVAAHYEIKEYRSFDNFQQQPKYERFYDSDDGL
jgi:hypothetical protein